ncbi:MAG: hypothetical protein RLZZ488_735 [Pseudomonadota bacterium]
MLMMAACGGLSYFDNKKGRDEATPATDPTVVPPIVVTGSYVTGILVDEFNAPLAQKDISADEGRYAVRTDASGTFKMPIAFLRDNSFDVDVKLGQQEIPLRLKPCPHLLGAIKIAAASEGVEAGLMMAVRLSESVSVLPNDPVSGEKVRILADSISVAKETGRKDLRESAFLQFKVVSPLSGDEINPDFTISGDCAVGYKVRVFGDVVVPAELTCTNSGGRGSFTANVSAVNRSGSNSVVFEHIEPSSGSLVSQLVLFKSSE